MILWGFLATAILYVLSTWLVVLFNKVWARLLFASCTTGFISYLLYIMWDYARWDGEAHITIINLLDIAVRQMQHMQ